MSYVNYLLNPLFSSNYKCMLPRLSHWVNLNVGLLVVEPNKAEFNGIMKMKRFLLSKDKVHHVF